MNTSETVRAAIRRVAAGLRRRSRLAGLATAGVTALGAAVVARRQRRRGVVLPDPTAGAIETAVSTHNAAKNTMISAVRTAEEPDLALVASTVREAIGDASEAGVDLVPVAIGVVDGASTVAHLLPRPEREVMHLAAASAVQVAGDHGATAGARLEATLAELLVEP